MEHLMREDCSLMQLAWTLIILGATIVLFVSNRFRSDLVSIFALLALMLTGILEPSEALAGFSNPVVIMFAGLFVVGAGIFQTGLARKAGDLLVRLSGESENRLLVMLMLIVASVGAFMSNTATVALMLPVVLSMAMSLKTSPAKYLIPLTYAANLSGTLTLIASPPNLIVSQALVDHGFKQLSFFQITPIGVACVLVGVAYMYLVRNILLPKGDAKTVLKRKKTTPHELLENYLLDEHLHCVRVPAGSPAAGKKLSEIKLPAKYQICVLQIERKTGEKRNLLPVTYREMAGPESVIMEDDIFYIQGDSGQVEKFVKDFQLEHLPERSEKEKLITKQMGVAEALLTPSSALIDKTIQDIRFREKYNLNIIGINRKGKYILAGMSSESLHLGDALLVQGAWENIEQLAKESSDVVIIGRPKEMASMAAASGKAPIAGAIMLLMVLLLIFEVFPAVLTVLICAVLMVLTGCVRNMEDAYSRINWESIVLMACMLPLATALEKSGGAEFITDAIISLFGSFGTTGILAGICLGVMIIGQFISNTATAVLFAPIALNAALSLGASPHTFMIAVAIAAAMSFSTPVASPTNVLVMTAGKYKFTDFIKVGVPLQIIMLILIVFLIPLIYPF